MSDKVSENKPEHQAPEDGKAKKWETILVERRERVGLITLRSAEIAERPEPAAGAGNPQSLAGFRCR